MTARPEMAAVAAVFARDIFNLTKYSGSIFSDARHAPAEDIGEAGRYDADDGRGRAEALQCS
jgi:hypothetical protein